MMGHHTGVTKIIVCSPGGKCTTNECNGLEKTIARAIVFKNQGTLSRAALKSDVEVCNDRTSGKIINYRVN